MITTTTPWRYSMVVVRLLLAVVFLVTGGSKVFHPWTFVHTVEGYNMLPDAVARPFALALPWIELLVGVYLLIGLFTRVIALASIVLLLVFIVALSTQIARGHTGNCGCVLGVDNPIVTAFVGGNDITTWDVIRDSILAVLSVALLVTPHQVLAVDSLLSRRREANAALDFDEDDAGAKDYNRTADIA